MPETVCVFGADSADKAPVPHNCAAWHFDCGSSCRAAEKRPLCARAPCLQAVRSVASSHQHDRFAIMFYNFFFSYRNNTDYYHIVCANVVVYFFSLFLSFSVHLFIFFVRPGRASVTVNNCAFDPTSHVQTRFTTRPRNRIGSSINN